jgi:hypothetical protein
MGWTTGVQFPSGAGIFSLLYRVQTGSGAHRASFPMGTGFFSGGKAAWAFNRPLTSSSAENKNAWSYTSTPPYLFMVWFLTKRRIRFHGMVLN